MMTSFGFKTQFDAHNKMDLKEIILSEKSQSCMIPFL